MDVKSRGNICAGPVVLGGMKRSHNLLLHQILRPRLVKLPPPDAVVCDACRSDAVALAEWDRHADGQWWAVLRCGDCGTWHDMVISQAAADRLDNALDAGLMAIAQDLEAIDRERMAAQADAFAVALERDLIDAADFASPPRAPSATDP